MTHSVRKNLLSPALLLVVAQIPMSGQTNIQTNAPTSRAEADSPRVVTLQTMRDTYRPLLVFTPTDNDLKFQSQTKIIATGSSKLHPRDVLFVPLIVRIEAKPGSVLPIHADTGQMQSEAAASEARRFFRIAPNDFTVILLGKDGGEKLRSHTPVTIEELSRLIDTMPMRQQEMLQHTRTKETRD